MVATRLSDLQNLGLFIPPNQPTEKSIDEAAKYYQETVKAESATVSAKSAKSDQQNNSDNSKNKIDDKSTDSSASARVGEGRQLASAPAYAAKVVKADTDTDSSKDNVNSDKTSEMATSTTNPLKDFPPTDVLYMNRPLSFTEVFSYEGAKILHIEMDKSDNTKCTIILDKSLFHPQGGGQPSDVGFIILNNHENGVVADKGKLPKVEVFMVKVDKDSGVATHECETEAPLDLTLWQPSAKVDLEVDGQVRMLNSRLHSAGHLLDAAVIQCGFKWQPAKGYHFPDGPNVEYVINEEDKKLIQGSNPKDKVAIEKAKDAVCKMIEEMGNKLIQERGLDKTGLQVYHKSGVRHVNFCGVESHCGGTHVENLAMIGKLVVTKIQPKKDRAKISYKVEPWGM